MMRALAIIALLATPAAADSKTEAQKHITRAGEAHAKGNYAEALQELTFAYALDPEPELLYAIGQVQMKLGHCSEAITFYKRFLATNPGSEDAGVAKKAIEACKVDKPAEPPPPVEPPPPIEPPKPPPVEPPKPAPPPKPVVVTPVVEPRAWYRDYLGDALVASGLVAGVAGIVVYRSAVADRDAADTTRNYTQYNDLLDSANSKRNIALGLGAAGIVLAGIGIEHWTFAGHGEVAAAPGGATDARRF